MRGRSEDALNSQGAATLLAVLLTSLHWQSLVIITAMNLLVDSFLLLLLQKALHTFIRSLKMRWDHWTCPSPTLSPAPGSLLAILGFLGTTAWGHLLLG